MNLYQQLENPLNDHIDLDSGNIFDFGFTEADSKQWLIEFPSRKVTEKDIKEFHIKKWLKEDEWRNVLEAVEQIKNGIRQDFLKWSENGYYEEQIMQPNFNPEKKDEVIVRKPPYFKRFKFSSMLYVSVPLTIIIFIDKWVLATTIPKEEDDDVFYLNWISCTLNLFPIVYFIFAELIKLKIYKILLRDWEGSGDNMDPDFLLTSFITLWLIPAIGALFIVNILENSIIHPNHLDISEIVSTANWIALSFSFFLVFRNQRKVDIILKRLTEHYSQTIYPIVRNENMFAFERSNLLDNRLRKPMLKVRNPFVRLYIVEFALDQNEIKLNQLLEILTMKFIGASCFYIPLCGIVIYQFIYEGSEQASYITFLTLLTLVMIAMDYHMIYHFLRRLKLSTLNGSYDTLRISGFHYRFHLGDKMFWLTLFTISALLAGLVAKMCVEPIDFSSTSNIDPTVAPTFASTIA